MWVTYPATEEDVESLLKKTVPTLQKQKLISLRCSICLFPCVALPDVGYMRRKSAAQLTDQDCESYADEDAYDVGEDNQYRDCPGGFGRMNFVVPYKPSKNVTWSSIPNPFAVSKWSLLYGARTVDGEYAKFLYRDCVLMIVASIACSPALLQLFGVIDLGPSLFIAWIPVFCVYMVVFLVEAYLHFVAPLSIKNGRRRRVLVHIFAAIYICMASLSVYGSTVTCEQAEGVFGAIWGDRATDAPQVACASSVANFSFILIILFVLVLNPNPLFIALLVPLRLACMGFGRMIPDLPSTLTEDSTVRVLRFVSSALADVVGIALMVARDAMQRDTFQQLLQTAIETERSVRIARETDNLLFAMVPPAVLPRLIQEEGDIVDSTPYCSVLFSDIAGFTAWSSTRTAYEVVSMLNVLCVEFDAYSADPHSGVEKVKTIGDAYWAQSGLPIPTQAHASNLINFARKMLLAVAAGNEQHPEWGGVQIRIGIHSGTAKAAILGSRQWSYEVFGETSELANEVEASGVPGSICVSGTTMHFLADDSSLKFTHSNIPRCTLQTSDGPLEVFELAFTTPSGASQGSGSRKPSMAHSQPSDRVSMLREAFTTLDDGLPKREGLSVEERSKFLGRRVQASRNAHGAENDFAAALNDELILNEINAKYTQRRFRFILLEFSDPVAEQEFGQLRSEKQQSTRKVARIGTLLFMILIFISLGVHRNASVPVATYVLLGIVTLTFLVLAIVCFAVKTPTRTYALVDEVVHCITGTVLIVALGIIDGDVFVGNNVAFVHTIIEAGYAFNVAGYNAIGYVAASFVFNTVPAIAFSTRLPDLGIMISYYITAVVLLSITAFNNEKRYRRQLHAERVAQHLTGVIKTQETARLALLESVAPSHVIAPLQKWISPEVAMDPLQSIHQDYPAISVAFVKMYHRDASIELTDWLLDAHRRVDELLATGDFPAFIKIKTIGNAVLLAGCFDESHSVSPQESASQLTEAVRHMINDFKMRNVILHAGLHHGPVVGAVLGLNRLAFDIFGDTVNTASRTLTSGVASCLGEEHHDTLSSIAHCTDNFFNLLPASKAQSQFHQQPIELLAKGKGTLIVYRMIGE